MVQLPAGSWHGLPRWSHGLCMKFVVSCGSGQHLNLDNTVVKNNNNNNNKNKRGAVSSPVRIPVPFQGLVQFTLAVSSVSDSSVLLCWLCASDQTQSSRSSLRFRSIRTCLGHDCAFVRSESAWVITARLTDQCVSGSLERFLKKIDQCVSGSL